MERSVWTGLAVFRWAAWAWMATVLLLARRSLEHPLVAWLLVALALAVTVWATLALRATPDRRHAPVGLAAEVAVGASLLLLDGYVYADGHVFGAEQPLGVAWPLAGVLAAGVARGPGTGALAGVGMGLSRAVSSTLAMATAGGAGASALVGPLSPAQVLSLVSTAVLYTLAGATAGHLTRLLRRAEREVSLARAREEVARTLHDGVLQTLAVVERRSGDPELTRLAREQEQELRAYLFDTRAELVGRGDLGDALRDAARRVERSFDVRVQVLVPDDLPALDPVPRDALVGAAGEALVNAGKHARARTVTVFVEPEGEGVTCSVRDDGVGFDPETVVARVGLTSSIRGRIADAGGEVTIDARPGRGTEVRMRVPAAAPDTG